MAKRRIDCSLEEYIIDHLKKRKYRKTLKLFEEQNEDSAKTDSELLSKFTKYLKKKEMKNEIDHLGFEINFGAFQPEAKVIFCPQYKFMVFNIL